jgi:hypothetical protein
MRQVEKVKKREALMVRFSLVFLLVLATQTLHAEPDDDLPHADPADVYASLLSACFEREASSASIANLDLDAAVHEVAERRCASERDAYETAIAKDYKGREAEFERWLRKDRASNIEHVKRVFAEIRKNRTLERLNNMK